MLREGEVRIPAGCAIAAVIDRSKTRFSCQKIVDALALMRERSNGLGGGIAAYGIYPQYADCYALHIFYDDNLCRQRVENDYLSRFEIALAEEIKTRKTRQVNRSPLIWRYFIKPRLCEYDDPEQDMMVTFIMEINSQNLGAYVFSSGKNMGAFKGVGFPEDIAEFFCLEDYQGYLWTGHGRFPTNTPGWWGGAHPFCLLDWSVVHNGELSSYGTNRAYLEMFGYKCSLQTDTEVIAYAFDLMVRRHGLPLEYAVQAACPPFWKQIDADQDQNRQQLARTIRMVYSSLLLNGPFSIVLATGRGMMGLNDRIKLRPMSVATQGELMAIASEEVAVLAMCPQPDNIWQPEGGVPALGLLKGESSLWH